MDSYGDYHFAISKDFYHQLWVPLIFTVLLFFQSVKTGLLLIEVSFTITDKTNLQYNFDRFWIS